jgi:hypothetical protein
LLPPLLPGKDEPPPPPQAARRISIENARHPSSERKDLCFQEEWPAPKSRNPPIGSNMAYKTTHGRGANDPRAAGVVRTVSVDVPEPGTELGANAHVGGEVTAGAMLLQVRLKVPLKLFS